jgi:hypothetical protein
MMTQQKTLRSSPTVSVPVSLPARQARSGFFNFMLLDIFSGLDTQEKMIDISSICQARLFEY